MGQFDVVVRAGTVVDGTGAPARTADVAVRDGVVVEVGRVDGVGRREIDADGCLVTPGFVDVHTHYDGQATWDDRLAPSSWHGVTTVVMGNCGVGFAPVHPVDRDRLIELMEGVEDIPGTALHEGLPWTWEGFEGYLDHLGGRRFDIDVATQVPHGALRLFVMGERGARREAATADDIVQMAAVARSAVEAGALGFTTSRTRNHRTSTGDFTPTLTAARDELVGIAAEIGRSGRGVLQVVSDFPDFDEETETIRAMAQVSGRPLSISVAGGPGSAVGHRRLLAFLERCNADGLEVRGQVAARGIGILLGMQATLHPFQRLGSYRALAGLPLADRVAALRTSEVRAAVLAEAATEPGAWNFANVFELGDPPDYEPDPASSIEARAAALDRPAAELAYDLLLGAEGTALLYSPVLNYGVGDLEPAREMLEHPFTIPGLSDGGAHVGTICDASFPTTLLQHWVRDRTRGPKLAVEHVVQRQCRDTAVALGLHDRGVLAPGYRADLNVIELAALRLHPPELRFDLPAGGKRLLQRVDGYRHTFVAGEETYHDGQATEALPGRLVRGGAVR